MSGESALIERTWKVGRRVVRMTAPRVQPGKPVCIAMEWAPEPPKHLSAEEWAAYMMGRDAALRELCEELGLRGLVVDL